MLHVVSALCGNIYLVDFISQSSETADYMFSKTDVIKSDLCKCLERCQEIEVTEAQSLSLIFISGYVGFKLVRCKVHCDLCTTELMSDHSPLLDVPLDQCEYLMDLDRGGLKWPTDLLVEAVTQIY